MGGFKVTNPRRRPVVIPFVAGPSTTHTPLLAVGEIATAAPRFRMYYDFTGALEVKFQCMVTAGGNPGNPAGHARMAPQYSLDDGSTWKFFDGSASGSYVEATSLPNVDIGTTPGYTLPRVSAWTPIAAEARTLVLLRPVTVAGDGTTSMTFGNTILAVR